MKIDGNQIKVGNILEINSKLWRVLKTQHTQPGKGGAYLQVEMKEIREGTKMNERFRSSESVERAILDEKICQFLSPFLKIGKVNLFMVNLFLNKLLRHIFHTQFFL